MRTMSRERPSATVPETTFLTRSPTRSAGTPPGTGIERRLEPVDELIRTIELARTDTGGPDCGTNSTSLFAAAGSKPVPMMFTTTPGEAPRGLTDERDACWPAGA